MSETDLYSLRTDSPGSELGAPLRFWVRWLQRRDFSYSCNTMGERGGCSVGPRAGGHPAPLEMMGACVLEIAYGWSNTVKILLMITTFNLEGLIWIRSK